MSPLCGTIARGMVEGARMRKADAGEMRKRGVTMRAFEKALKSLAEVLAVAKSDIVRDAAVRRFSYTFEIARRLIEGHLLVSFGVNRSLLGPRDMFREAAQAGLIDDAEAWLAYDQAWTKSSLLSASVGIFRRTRNFALDAGRLFETLEEWRRRSEPRDGAVGDAHLGEHDSPVEPVAVPASSEGAAGDLLGRLRIPPLLPA